MPSSFSFHSLFPLLSARLVTRLYLWAVILLLAGIGALRVNANPPATLTSGLEFASTPGRVTLDSSFSLAGRDFTVEAWIYLKASGGDRPVLAQIGEGNLFHLLVRENRLHLGFFADDLTGSTAVPTGEWVHVAYSYEAATRTQRVFLNGVADGERIANAQFAENNLPLQIGAYVDPNLNPFDGRMLELRVWDHARPEATIAAERFITPATNAPGLDALFTFLNSNVNLIREATGKFPVNTPSGNVTVVEPVPLPLFLGTPFPVQPLPAGNLTAMVSGYTISPASAAAYPDPDGDLLINGTGPARVWGTTWIESMVPAIPGLLLWEDASPEITLTFASPVRVDVVTFYLSNSGGMNGVSMPSSIQISVPGGNPVTEIVFPDLSQGDLEPVSAGTNGVVTETLIIQLVRDEHDIALAEIAIFGEVLQSQSIDFPVVTPVPFTETITLAATASSGLPVSFAVVSGPAILEGNTLTFTAAGMVVVAANQAGNDSFLPAEAATQSFTVLKAAQEVMFTQAIPSALATGTVTLDDVATASSGLPVNYEVVSGPAVLEGNTLTFTAAGTVVVAASQAGNDSFLPAEAVTQSFTVAKAPQQITEFQSIGNVPFTAAPLLSASADSGLPVSFSVVSGPATIDGNQLTFTSTGSVTVAASQTGSDSFLPAAPVSQTFEVIKATQEISDFPEMATGSVEAIMALTATADSGLPVSYEVLSGPGIPEDGNALRFTGPGVVLVVARQSGDARWEPALERLQAIEVLDGTLLLHPEDGLTAGLEFGTAPGRVELDSNFSLAHRSFTVEAWIWLNDISGDRSVLGQLGVEDLLHLNIREGRLHLGFWSDDLTGETVLPVNEWVHVAFTFDTSTSTQRVYVNGVNDGSRIADNWFMENFLPLQIGGGYSQTGSAFNGRVLELRIWDYARPGPVLSAGRFTTPPGNAPGLRALFTFEAPGGPYISDMARQIGDATMVGDVAVVEPVIGLDYLNFTFPLQSLPQGSLSPFVSGYALNEVPLPEYADVDGSLLTNGLGPSRVWGTPWMDSLQKPVGSILVWEQVDPTITLSLTERSRVEAVTLHLAHSNGAASVDLPEVIQLSTAGGFVTSVPVSTNEWQGTLLAVRVDGLDLIADALTITLPPRAAGRVALAEIQLDGTPLRIVDPAPSDEAPRAARLFHGFDPALDNRAVLRPQLELVAGEAQFRFQRGADRLGVEAVTEWSTDLQNWAALPYEINPEDGSGVTRFSMEPGQDRTFFRLRYVTPPATNLIQPPEERVFEEGATPRAFPPGFLFGSNVAAEDAGNLELVALNDQPGLLGSTLEFDFGVTLRINADGSGELFTPISMPGHAVVDEVITYTVVNSLGESIRRSFAFTVNGVNNAPSVEPIALSHASGVVDAGTAYRFFEGDYPTEASLLEATPTATGRQPTFSLEPAAGATGGFGLEMTGELFVPAPGPYTFFLAGNNTSVLDVAGTRVIAGDDTERSGTIELTAGTHTVRVLYFDTTEPAAELSVEYLGPGFIREAIPSSAFPRLTAIALDPLAGASDPDAGDVLTISHIEGQAIDLNTPARLPSGAEVHLNGDGTLSYIPAPGRTVFHEATDSVSFTYTVTDTGGLTASASATIELARVNAAPVANPAYELVVRPDTSNAHIWADDAAQDADNDLRRITHVNGQPIVGGELQSLPSTALVTLSTIDSIHYPENAQTVPFGLTYDGLGAFLLTLDSDQAAEAFTITVTDSAGATVDIALSASWTVDFDYTLRYFDSRMDDNLGPRTAQIESIYLTPLTAAISLTDRKTGIRYGQTTHTFYFRQSSNLDFDLPEGIDLDGQHFFERFDLEIDTLDGVPLYHAASSINSFLVPLYSTASKSFYRVVAPQSRHWPIDLRYRPVGQIGGSEVSVPQQGGIFILETQHGSILQLFRQGLVRRGSSPQLAIVEPTFASNIIIEGLCRTTGSGAITRFQVENRNDEPVPLTVGSSGIAVMVQAGQTREFEVAYEPKIPVFVLQGYLGLFDSREVSCTNEIDFTITSLCADTFISFTQVRNNDPANARTVRIESVLFPMIRSEPITIGNQAEEFLQMNTQGQDLGGTEGRLVILLPGLEIIGPTFIFSSDSCFLN